MQKKSAINQISNGLQEEARNSCNMSLLLQGAAKADTSIVICSANSEYYLVL